MSRLVSGVLALLLVTGSLIGVLAPQAANAQQERSLIGPEASAHANGLIFAQNPAGTVFGIDEATGAARWQFDAGSVGYYPVFLLGDLLMAGNETGDLFALDSLTGTEVWEKTDIRVVYPPVSDGATIYAGSVEGSLFAFDPATGDQRWEAKLFEWGVVGPTLADGRLFAAAPQFADLVSVDAASGAELWRVDAGAPTESPPVVTNGLVLLSNYTGNLLIFDAATGASYCTIELGDGLFLAPADEFGNVFSTSIGGYVAAFLPASCTLAWYFQAAGPFLGQPSVQNGIVYAHSALGSVALALDSGSGGLIWSYPAPSKFSVAGDMAFVLQDGTLVALASGTGAELWRFTGGSALASIPFRTDQSVVIGDDVGMLYAIDPATGQQRWSLDTGTPAA